MQLVLWLRGSALHIVYNRACIAPHQAEMLIHYSMVLEKIKRKIRLHSQR